MSDTDDDPEQFVSMACIFLFDDGFGAGQQVGARWGVKLVVIVVDLTLCVYAVELFGYLKFGYH